MYSSTIHMSVTDPLTKLYNRRHFESNFEREYIRAKRYNSPLSLAIVDIDFFKKFNDTNGHSCGDYVLRELAYNMLQNFRQTDMVFRYGGEEFAVILTETPAETAVVPAEDLRHVLPFCNRLIVVEAETESAAFRDRRLSRQSDQRQKHQHLSKKTTHKKTPYSCLG